MRTDKEKLSFHLEIKSQKFPTSCLRLFATAGRSVRLLNKFVLSDRKFYELMRNCTRIVKDNLVSISSHN